MKRWINLHCTKCTKWAEACPPPPHVHGLISDSPIPSPLVTALIKGSISGTVRPSPSYSIWAHGHQTFKELLLEVCIHASACYTFCALRGSQLLFDERCSAPSSCGNLPPPSAHVSRQEILLSVICHFLSWMSPGFSVFCIYFSDIVFVPEATNSSPVSRGKKRNNNNNNQKNAHCWCVTVSVTLVTA